MNKEIQEKIDKQVGEGKTPKKSFRVVEVSDAPLLTDDFIKSKGKKTYTVEFVFDDDIYQIEVRRGMPLEFSVLLKVTGEVYALRRNRDAESKQSDGEDQQTQNTADVSQQRSEEDRNIKQIIVASMVVRKDPKTKELIPVSSLNGKGGKIPIEDQSDLLLAAFHDVVMEVQTPEGYTDALHRFQTRSGDDGSGEDNRT